MSKTLTASGWSGTSAPYSQTISVGTEYTDPKIFEITSNPCSKTSISVFVLSYVISFSFPPGGQLEENFNKEE